MLLIQLLLDVTQLLLEFSLVAIVTAGRALSSRLGQEVHEPHYTCAWLRLKREGLIVQEGLWGTSLLPFLEVEESTK